MKKKTLAGTEASIYKQTCNNLHGNLTAHLCAIYPLKQREVPVDLTFLKHFH